jgi:ABC-type lipoprotein export system ATPase subunit
MATVRAAARSSASSAPNGAGKSTTINMLCTLARPTSGTARVSGFDVAGERDDVRRHIGLVFQDPTLDGYLTAEQNLRLRPLSVEKRPPSMRRLVPGWSSEGQGQNTPSSRSTRSQVMPA